MNMNQIETSQQFVDLRPLGSVLGAEVLGLDLSRAVPRELAKQLDAALDAYSLLLFRGQNLDEEEQLRLAELFGGGAVRTRPDAKRAEDNPYARSIGLVTNIRRDGKPIGSLPDGELWFHHDGCFVDEPYRATLLYAVEVPRTGGDTRFANMHLAFDALDADTKAALRGRVCVNYFDHEATAARAEPQRDLSDVRFARHPAVIRHPHTGRPALYVNPLLTARIEGMEASESEALLQRAFAYTENENIIHDHVWQAGDLVIWDNWASAHARTDFPADQTRLLRRSIVKGEPVEAADY